ncbi:MAG: hypothetical protein SFW36_12315, partial [Leptolyngbyaceae cyanobacterium bins.59]|nr:hypothetical protein [Leptolyngbyaceae cyanobacterium bins.59]
LASWGTPMLILAFAYCAALSVVIGMVIFPHFVARTLQNIPRSLRIVLGAMAGVMLALSPVLLFHQSSRGVILGRYTLAYAGFLVGYHLVLGAAFLGACYAGTVASQLQKIKLSQRTVQSLLGALAVLLLGLLVAITFHGRLIAYLGPVMTTYLMTYLGLLVGLAAFSAIYPVFWAQWVQQPMNLSGPNLANLNQRVLSWAVSFLFLSPLVLPYMAGQFQSLRALPIHQLPASDVLNQYQGQSFVTTATSAYVSYFTQDWAIHLHAADIKGSLNSYSIRYAFERDRLSNLDYLKPDFYLCTERSNCYAPDAESMLEVSDAGDGWAIYRMKHE